MNKKIDIVDLMSEIKTLEGNLREWDYKTIRNIETECAGIPPPIHWSEIYAMKQSWRDRINELQNKIAQLAADGAVARQ